MQFEERFENLPENVPNVLLRLQRTGAFAFLAGGCVRDRLLGLEPKDTMMWPPLFIPKMCCASFQGLSSLESPSDYGSWCCETEPVYGRLQEIYGWDLDFLR